MEITHLYIKITAIVKNYTASQILTWTNTLLFVIQYDFGGYR